ncbi:YdcF family protein [Candidatus Pelagibacter sp.]|nr:YdcF family protein [Candidatus Pelagibacter sp.]
MYFYLSKILAPFLNPTNLLFFLLIFFIFKNIKLKIRFKFLFIFITFIITFISILPIGKIGLKYLENDYVFQEKLSNISNIFILAGSEEINSTKATNKLNLNNGSERLISSVKLALDNPNATIYFIGGDGNLIKNEINEINVAQLFFEDIGFDTSRVKFIQNTRNTIENLKALKKINIQDHLNVLITSAFHMKRSMIIANTLDIKIKPYAVDFRSIEKFNLINYYQRLSVASNWDSFNIFFRELLGIFAFKLFY